MDRTQDYMHLQIAMPDSVAKAALLRMYDETGQTINAVGSKYYLSDGTELGVLGHDVLVGAIAERDANTAND